MESRNHSSKTIVPQALTAAAMTLALAACGGGGSNVRPDTVPDTVVKPVVSTPNPAYSKHLTLTHADEAHQAGFTGAGYKIGVVDTGVMRNHPALSPRVTANLNYVSSSANNLTVDDVVGHGTAVSQLAAGTPFGSWPGGVAPGATIVSARIISDKPPVDDGSGNGNQTDGALGLASIHQDLISRGVRIMNNSWGGLYWTSLSATNAIAEEYRPFVISNDGLVVFATGNESKANPSDMAALPSKAGPGGSKPAADLERGWLAVAALDTDIPTQLASYSNACGVAMRYCLVAPGNVTITGTDDSPTNPTYWSGGGTSFAAPLVSGAAAVVWQAFPYFNNDLVRQTLLGTATDLGTPGVDSTFGYGLLNVGKAIKGPAKFDWGTVDVNLTSGTSTWSNDITGSGGLTKRGAGTLSLTGAANYTGSTTASAGKLVIAQQLHGGATINSGATLQLGAGVNGNLINNGTLAQQGSAGSRVITGNYQQSSSAKFSHLIGAPLLVTGTANIAGELQVAGVASGYTYSSRENVIVTTSGLSGTFSSLTSGTGVFLQATAGYDSLKAWLDITRLDVTAAAQSFGIMTPAALGSAERVEKAFRKLDGGEKGGGTKASAGFLQAAGDFQHAADAGAAEDSLLSLSGASHAAAAAMTFDAIDMNRRALSQRYSELAGHPARAGTWFQALGGTHGGYDGSGFAVRGWMQGQDLAFANGGVAGFAFGQTQTSNAYSGSQDRSEDRQTQAQFYLGALHGRGYSLAQFGVGHYQRQLQRELLLGQRKAGVFTDYSGDFVASSLESGYRFGGANRSLTPYLGVQYARVHRDGFSEQGGEGFGLRANTSWSERSQALAGLRAQRDWRQWSLRGYAEWQETLAAHGDELQASFVGIDAWAPLAGMLPAQSGGLYGLSIEHRLTDRARLSLAHDQRFGPRQPLSQVSLQFGWDF